VVYKKSSYIQVPNFMHLQFHHIFKTQIGKLGKKVKKYLVNPGN